MKKSELKSYIKENIRLTLSEEIDNPEYYFEYLTKLRDSGVTNMFGAAPYLMAEFGLDKRTAREILAKWMKSFSENVSEASPEDVKAQQDYNAELEKTAQLKKDAGIEEGNDSDKFQDDGYVNHTYNDSVIDKYNVPVEPTAVFEDDEDEPKASDLKKEPLSKIGYKLADTQKEMKRVVKKYSAAEGDEKEKLKDRLRELNKIKKELESLL